MLVFTSLKVIKRSPSSLSKGRSRDWATHWICHGLEHGIDHGTHATHHAATGWAPVNPFNLVPEQTLLALSVANGASKNRFF